MRRLNELQPTGLVVYSSALRMLSDETRAGRLRIQPRIVMAGGEPLLPRDVERVRELWDAAVFDVYGASEVGMLASSDGFSAGLCLNDDIAIIELVGADSRPVRPGERTQRLFVTPLRHRSLPLFRYEITDEVTLLEASAAADHPMRRIDHVTGRVDEVFDYGGGVTIHPIVFRSLLTERPEISAYQVRQTSRGAEISVVVEGALDLGSFARDVEEGLRGAGLSRPQVRVERRDSIARTENGQKLRRFVPASAG